MSKNARLLLALITLLLVSCSSSAKSVNAGRPHSDATLRITTPAPLSTTGRTVNLMMQLDGGHLVPASQTGGVLRGDEGHIHVSLDGNLIAMPVRSSLRIPGLARGHHTIEAEFVASDHLAFANHVVAAVTFNVR
jgi:hypothetical protein